MRRATNWPTSLIVYSQYLWPAKLKQRGVALALLSSPADTGRRGAALVTISSDISIRQLLDGSTVILTALILRRSRDGAVFVMLDCEPQDTNISAAPAPDISLTDSARAKSSPL